MVTPVQNTSSLSYSFATYVTAQEYKQYPSGVDVSNLVPGNPSASDAELNNRIRAATGWVDTICGQSLLATTDNWTDVEAVIDREGYLRLHLPKFPVQQVNSISYGATRNSVFTMSDLSNVEFGRQGILSVPLAGGTGTWSGPLQLSSPPARPGARVYAAVGAVSGYVITTLAATATAGAGSIQVADATGVVPGVTTLILVDGAQTEAVQVAATTAVGATTLTLVAPLVYTHAAAGIRVTGMPENVRTATFLLLSTLIQTRGAVALIAPAVGGMGSRYTQSGSQRSRGQKIPMDDNVEMACDLLSNVTRTR